jgi:sialate O-acetylesterase
MVLFQLLYSIPGHNLKERLHLLTVIFLVATILSTTPVVAQSPIKVACIGNSVTYGYGLQNPAIESYPAQLQKLLGDHYQVGNFGHSGATLLRHGHNPYFKTAEFKAALDMHPDIAIIHLGLNDTDPRNWPNYQDEFAGDYASLIDRLRRSNPAVRIYICKLTPIFNDHPRFKSGTRDWFWQIQSLLPRIAKANKVKLIDLHSPLYQRPDLFPDALHPNAAGAAILANTVYQQVTGNYGGLRLASIFASHMVVQRGQALRFFGQANAGEKINVRFHNQRATVVTNDYGQWMAVLPAMKAGGPYKLRVESDDRHIELTDIMVGELWLCSGQSNMYFPLKNALMLKGEMKSAQSMNNVRLCRMQPIAETDDIAWDSTVLKQVNELHYFNGSWSRCDSAAAASFSAVAYFFGKKLQETLGVPVGLIQLAVGGSTTESWIDRYTMEQDPVLVNELDHWRKSDFFMPWVRERANRNLQLAVNPRQRHPYDPCYNYEAGILNIKALPIAGVTWYQGESNAHNIELHAYLFKKLVESWRHNWGDNLPFYYVQLSSINRPSWTRFRYSQLQLLKEMPHTGMAVSSDWGDPENVHPRNKQPVGERLANLALHFTYHKKEIVPYGPMPLKAIQKGDTLYVKFNYTRKLKTSDGQPLRGFALEDAKGRQQDVDARISRNEVLIPLSREAHPFTLLYGWTPYSTANLQNEAGLPASTFRLPVEKKE